METTPTSPEGRNYAEYGLIVPAKRTLPRQELEFEDAVHGRQKNGEFTRVGEKSRGANSGGGAVAGSLRGGCRGEVRDNRGGWVEEEWQPGYSSGSGRGRAAPGSLGGPGRGLYKRILVSDSLIRHCNWSVHGVPNDWKQRFGLENEIGRVEDVSSLLEQTAG